MELSSLVIALLIFLLSSHLETYAILACVFSFPRLVFSSYFPFTYCTFFPYFFPSVLLYLSPLYFTKNLYYSCPLSSVIFSFISCPAHDHTNSKQGNRLEGMDFYFVFPLSFFFLLFFFIFKQYLPDLWHSFLCIFFSTPLPFTSCFSFSFVSSFLFFSTMFSLHSMICFVFLSLSLFKEMHISCS